MVDLADLLNIIAAMGAIGTASFGLVDATKAFWGGVSNIGFGHLERCLTQFKQTLTAALGEDWKAVFRAHWRNGVSKDQQKAIIRATVRLGLTQGTVGELAAIGRVKGGALKTVVDKLEEGGELSAEEVNLMGRVDAAMAALIDAAYERAEQQYRNVARVLAGGVAIGLSIGGGALLPAGYAEPKNLGIAVLVGILAVPVAPIAKDLSGALTTAVKAMAELRSGG